MSSETRSNKEQSPEPPFLILPSLPEDIILDILARVRSCYGATIQYSPLSPSTSDHLLPPVSYTQDNHC
ncbi:hypothetical protein Bca52824_048989 [Brassica carinata]|uniref:Uncharacterized protein n=1 Tax=Brassica carinata TaxID=52824 RepID=A0A8X7RJI5_BRACI|nr:hypothetical protein Bca52824_048989 [Brassica carinata]